MKAVLAIAAVGTLSASSMLGFLSGGQAQAQPQEINVYSARHYNTDKEFYGRFEQQTGIKVNLLESSGDVLLSRQALGVRELLKKPGSDTIRLSTARVSTGLLKCQTMMKETFSEVPKHDFGEMLTLAVIAVICGYEICVHMENFSKAHKDHC